MEMITSTKKTFKEGYKDFVVGLYTVGQKSIMTDFVCLILVDDLADSLCQSL